MDMPDLDGLLEESQSMLSLDDLLKESKLAAKAKTELAESRKRVALGGGKFANLDEDLRRIREWEAANVWRAEALVATFTVTECQACRGTSKVFSTLFVREVARNSTFSRRWVAVEGDAAETSKLPRETGIIFAQAPMCSECAGGQGWDLATAKEISR